MASPTLLHGGTAPLTALTTVFTPTCSTSWLLTTTRVLSQHPAFAGAGPPGCDPPDWIQNLDGQGFQYYSPAICPQGFNVGSNCIISTQTKAGEGFPAMAPGETAAWCVPNGMTCTGDTTDFRGGFWGFAAAATTSNAPIVYGPVLQIRWVDADLSRLETHPLTPGLLLAGATAASSPPPATSPSGFTTIPSNSPAATPTATPTGVASSTTSQRSISTMGINTNTQGTQPASSSGSNDIDPKGSPSPSDATNPAAPTQTNGQAPSSSGPPPGLGSPSSGFMSDARTSTAIIVLLSVLIATLLGFLAFVLLRRRRHGHAAFGFSPAGSMGSLVRLRVNRGRTYRYSDSMQSSKRVAQFSTPSLDDAEGGFMDATSFGRGAAPMAEVGPNPARGTHLNPAELEAADAAAARPRWSWKSRVSEKLAWLSRPSTPSRSTPTPSSYPAVPTRSSSRRTATTSCTMDRQSLDEKTLPGVPIPGLPPTVPVVAAPGTTKMIRIQGSRALQDDVPPPLPEKNAWGLHVPRTSAWNRRSGGSDRSARTFGARPPRRAPHADAIPPDDVVGSAGDEGRSSSPRPEPPDK